MATKTADNVTIGTGLAVWNPDGTNRVVVTGVTFSVSAGGSVALKDGAAGAVQFRTPVLAANAPYSLLAVGDPLFVGSPGATVVLTGPGAVTGTLWGHEEAM